MTEGNEEAMSGAVSPCVCVSLRGDVAATEVALPEAECRVHVPGHEVDWLQLACNLLSICVFLAPMLHSDYMRASPSSPGF